jgi:hypothetical protein
VTASGQQIKVPVSVEVHNPGIGLADMKAEAERQGISVRILAHADGDGESAGVTCFSSLSKFSKDMQEGGFPCILTVDANHRIINRHADGTDNYGVGWHVLLVTGYNPATGEVRISNSWGSSSDKTLQIADLYRATMPC